MSLYLLEAIFKEGDYLPCFFLDNKYSSSYIVQKTTIVIPDLATRANLHYFTSFSHLLKN
jgi:hypothetical protein